MGQIRIVRPDDRTVQYGREFLSAVDENTPEGLLNSEARPYFPVGGESLWLWEFTMGANVQVRIHAHDADEILLVLDGGLRFGAQVCPPGTAVYVPKDTLYGEQSGPEGCRVLVFRGQSNVATIMKDQFVAGRAAALFTTDADG